MKFDDDLRLKALADYRVLDTPEEPAFDNLTRLAARLFQTPIALVTLVDEKRQWFKSNVGFDVRETRREDSFCDHVIRDPQRTPMVVSDASADPRFAQNPLVTGAPAIRFYCGVPLRTPDGHGLGTLCLMDKVPRTLAQGEVETLEAFARQVELELEIRRRLSLLEEALKSQQDQLRSNELLASMFVHDLRSPLTSLTMLASLVQPADEHSRGILDELLFETERMRRMLTDVLDICLYRAGGLRVRSLEFSMQALARRVEQRMSRLCGTRGQSLVLHLPDETVNVHADPELIERVIENLVGNAIVHGPYGKPIVITLAQPDSAVARIEVSDLGSAIAPEVSQRMFEPFEHQSVNLHQGYGLGLAFCRLAVHAHRGTIGVVSDPTRGNRFYFEIPLHR